MSIWLPCLVLLISYHGVRTTNMCPAGCECDNNVKSANCAGKNLKDVPRSLPPDLEILRLEGNSITNMDALSLSNYRNLRTLDVSYNKITDIAQDAFSGNPQLQVLKLQGNLLTAPPVQGFDSTNQLQELVLGENRISKIFPDTFTLLRNLRLLDLGSNSILDIPNGAFGPLSILRQLDLSENGITNVTARHFMGLRSMTQLKLARNKISHIQENAFRELPNLEILDLSENSISELELHTSLGKLQELKLNANKIVSFAGLNFTHVPKLRELYLGQNQISTIPPHMFKQLNELEILYLNHLPNLEFIDYRAFCGLSSVRIVDLGHNPKLDTIDRGLFMPTKNLTTINLSFDNFSSFYQETFIHLEHLKTLLLNGNPLNCNCAAKWLQGWSNSRTVKCNAPEAFKNYSITDVPVENLTCSNAKITNHTQHAFFKIGSEASLKCHVSGEPVPSITWITPGRKVFKHNDYLSNAEISDITHEDVITDEFHKLHHWHDSVHYFHNTSHDRVQILANGDLYIDYVQRSDAGPYTCIAKNPGGNDTVVTRFRLNYLILYETKITSLIIGFGSAGIFLGLGLLVGLLRFLCNRCEKKERMERKTRTIRKLLDNLDAYKTHQLDKLKDNYGLHVTKMKEQAFMHMEKMQKNYNQQLQKIRDNCAGQMDKLRENYNTQMGKIKGYSTHQIDKIRENYNSQMIKIRDYGSVQLEKLRDTYKLQHMHLIKILEAMNIDNCRGVGEDPDCLHADSSLFDQLNLDTRFDLLDLKTPSRNSISDDEFVSAISNADGISLDALTSAMPENLSLGNFDTDLDLPDSDRSTPNFLDPYLSEGDPDKAPDVTDGLMTHTDAFTAVDLNIVSRDDMSSSSNPSQESSPQHHHVVEIKPPGLSCSQVESNV
ncbi:leucine-rich repeat and immunoglobulin-like domain-containing nogo receptor-interacting protein 3 [Lineus longissimus]|uniref:leucine-rich repeat and immunoglobulin-like domain-containing nogo receptor-interacting protein 3 n=1 Tax=Lineus longissimus TaxID=88925 RepID=UPI002B4FA89A